MLSLLLLHSNTPEKSHQMTSYIELLHLGSNPWLFFAMSFDLTWMPHWDILDIGWISLHRNTKVSRLFIPQLNSSNHKNFFYSYAYWLHLISTINLSYEGQSC